MIQITRQQSEIFLFKIELSSENQTNKIFTKCLFLSIYLRARVATMLTNLMIFQANFEVVMFYN